MFEHSIKVPRLYKTAAKIAQKAKEGRASVKQLVYEKQHPNIKAVYALVVATLQNETILDKLMKKSQLLTKEPRFDEWLARILMTELLFGKKKLSGESKPVKTILGYEQIFKAFLSDTTNLNTETFQAEKPRYVRVNTIKCAVQDAINNFIEEGWRFQKCIDTNYENFLSKIKNLQEDQFMNDLHVSDLLIFPPRTEFYQHEAYKNGSIILQDKASCLPAFILNPTPGSSILDMCAAPGMKTTQLAALVGNQGLIYACEQNERRYQTLQKIVKSAGATCVRAYNEDVLNCISEFFPEVEYILVDPSCSGSGMADRCQIEESIEPNRLDKLAGFQIKILRHALLKFPSAKRVVYSTCSIYPEENEDVVRQVLETNKNFKLVPASEYINGAWTNFGSDNFGKLGSYCLYAKPLEDLTNGFFVAVFERLEGGETNEFFNQRVSNYIKHKLEQEKYNQDRNQLAKEEEAQKENQRHSFNEFQQEENTAIKEETAEHVIKKERKDFEETIIQTTGKKEKKLQEITDLDIKQEGSSKKKKKKAKVHNKDEVEDLNIVIKVKEESVQSEENAERSSAKDKNTNLTELYETCIKSEKKKKKKKLNDNLGSSAVEQEPEDIEKTYKNKEKRKRKPNGEYTNEVENMDSTEAIQSETCIKIKKNKKKKVNDEELPCILDQQEAQDLEGTNKKKKKKKQKSEDKQENCEKNNPEEEINKKKKRNISEADIEIVKKKKKKNKIEV